MLVARLLTVVCLQEAPLVPTAVLVLFAAVYLLGFLIHYSLQGCSQSQTSQGSN